MEKPHTYVFFGMSGAGKGTQVELLSAFFKRQNIPAINFETGSVMRRLTKTENTTGERTRNIVNTGGLMPEFIPIWAWTDFLVKNFTGREAVLLDGVCRRVEETIVMDRAFDFYDMKPVHIIFLDVSKEWARDRLKGRGEKSDRPEDDHEETIQKRLAWFDRDVLPVLDFFRKKEGYHFHTIQGEQTIEEVYQEILQKLGLSDGE